MKKLTEQQIAYIIDHKNDQPRKKVAEAIGVSERSVNRIARRHGGERLVNCHHTTEGIEECVRRHYPTMTQTEIAAKFGYSKGLVQRWASKLKVRHTPETYARIAKERDEKLATAAKATAKQRGKTWRARRKLDEMRIWEGKQQRTRHKFRELTVRTYQAKRYLIHAHGYIASEDDPHVLRYDCDTRRCNNPRYSEAYYETRYHLRFEAAEETAESEPQDRQAV